METRDPVSSATSHKKKESQNYSFAGVNLLQLLRTLENARPR